MTLGSTLQVTGLKRVYVCVRACVFRGQACHAKASIREAYLISTSTKLAARS